MHHRICNWLYNASTLQIALVFYKILTCIMIVAFMLELPFIYQMITYKWFVLVKCFAAVNAVLLFEHLYWYIYHLITSFIPRITFEDEENYDIVTKINPDEIEFKEIMEFIYQEEWFPVWKTKEQFWLSVQQIKQIGDDLESVWILVRGPNNARVLNTEINRSVVDELIADVNVSINKINWTFIQTNSWYDTLPSMIKQASAN